MKTIESLGEWRQLSNQVEGRVGFVPTMGALHSGHTSLIKECKRENAFTVVSIFVNPTQFDDPDDFSEYPKVLAEDIGLCEELEVDVLLLPTKDELYADNYRYKLLETDFSRDLCGAHRKDHFSGVLTIVMKLLNLVKPDAAYFGEKDYQQYSLIKDMCLAFFMDIEIISCPTVRENDGLAKSSRNRKLDRRGRKIAGEINRLIGSVMSDREIEKELEHLGFDVDYVRSIGGRRFVAARIVCGGSEVRLIDNMIVPGNVSSL